MGRQAVSSLSGVRISKKRRDGNTTRIIDNIIQLLFRGKKVMVEDHFSGKGYNKKILHTVTERIEREHFLVGCVSYDKEKNELSLQFIQPIT